MTTLPSSTERETLLFKRERYVCGALPNMDSFLLASVPIFYTSHRLQIIIYLFPPTQIQSNYDSRQRGAQMEVPVFSVCWYRRCYGDWSILAVRVLLIYGFSLMIEVFVQLQKNKKNVKNPHSPVNLCRWLYKSELKRLFQFRQPHSLKHTVEKHGDLRSFLSMMQFTAESNNLSPFPPLAVYSSLSLSVWEAGHQLPWNALSAAESVPEFCLLITAESAYCHRTVPGSETVSQGSF